MFNQFTFNLRLQKKQGWIIGGKMGGENTQNKQIHPPTGSILILNPYPFSQLSGLEIRKHVKKSPCNNHDLIFVERESHKRKNINQPSVLGRWL